MILLLLLMEDLISAITNSSIGIQVIDNATTSAQEKICAFTLVLLSSYPSRTLGSIAA